MLVVLETPEDKKTTGLLCKLQGISAKHHVGVSAVAFHTPPELRAESMLRYVAGQVHEAQSGAGFPARNTDYHAVLGYVPLAPPPVRSRFAAADLFNLRGRYNAGPDQKEKEGEVLREKIVDGKVGSKVNIVDVQPVSMVAKYPIQ